MACKKDEDAYSAISRSVVQPTLERAGDPALASQFSSYVSKAGTVLSEGARVGGGALASGLQAGSSVLKRDLGVDVGDLGAHYVERATGRGAGQGYGQVGFSAPSAEQQEEGDDFFGDHLGANSRQQGYGNGPSPGSSSSSSPAPTYQSGGGDYGGEDSWAKLAPQSAGRTGVAGPASAGSSRISSGRASPAVKPAPKPKAKADDWDDFGAEEKW